jgi:hypothetical protein
MTKATIDDIDVAGKRVVLRVDFNVPLRNGRIVDDRRIRAALPTIEALRQRGARTVIVTHVGRPGGHVEPSLSVQPIAERLGELLGVEVAVARDVAGPSAQATVDALASGDVAMLENVRFEAGEERNDPALARRLASFGDVYVNDAFGTAHRAHASTEGVAHVLPAVAGSAAPRSPPSSGFSPTFSNGSTACTSAVRWPARSFAPRVCKPGARWSRMTRSRRPATCSRQPAQERCCDSPSTSWWPPTPVTAR